MATPFSDGVVSNVSLSGSNNVDSLLAGSKWSNITGTGFNLTYSFGGVNSVYKADYYDGEPFSGFGELTDTQKDDARNALTAWSEIANLQFTEVTDSDSVAGDLRFANSSVPDTAETYYPAASPEAGDVWFGDLEVGEDTTPGSFNYVTRFLHEIGHALGLKHPHGTNGSGVLADPDIDTTAYTVMSYRSYIGQPIDALQQDFYPTTPMLNDIAAIQHIYGANINTRSGDTVYSWEPNQQLLETIWDGGGTDTIDWSNQSKDAKINLGAGDWSELGRAYWNGQEPVSQTLAIAYDVTIENANGGSGNDAITGNNAANYLTGGDGHDDLTGLNGDDCLNGGSGDDTIAGGDGYDKLTGGTGADTFVFYSPWEGSDCITDFSGKGDKIEISAEGFGIGTNNYHKFTFDSYTGALYFDETQFASLSNPYCVSSPDIAIV